MKRIRIAVGSNDGERINPGHLGMAKDFYIFDIFRNGSSSFVEKRRNTSPPEIVKHGDPRKMRGVLQLCSGCDVIIGRKSSPNFIRVSKNTKFQPIVIEMERLKDIINEMSVNYEEIYGMIQHRKEGEKSEKVPKFPK